MLQGCVVGDIAWVSFVPDGTRFAFVSLTHRRIGGLFSVVPSGLFSTSFRCQLCHPFPLSQFDRVGDDLAHPGCGFVALGVPELSALSLLHHRDLITSQPAGAVGSVAYLQPGLSLLAD